MYMVSAVSKLPIEFVAARIFTFDLLVYLYTSTYLLEKRLGYFPQEFLQVYVISVFRHIGETRLIDEG